MAVLREHLGLGSARRAGARRRRSPGRSSVAREHDEERHPGPSAARHGGVVVADAVVKRPAAEEHDRAREAGARPREPPAPGDGQEERDERERQQDLFAGRMRTSSADPDAERGEAPAGRGPHRAGEQERPQCEPRREDRVARGLVVQRRERRVDEQQAGSEERRDAPEGERRRAPARRSSPRTAQPKTTSSSALPPSESGTPSTIGVSGVRKSWSSEIGGSASASCR